MRENAACDALPQTGETRSDVYQRITDALVRAAEPGHPSLDEALGPHQTQRRKSPCPLRHNGKAYRGINVLMLWLHGMERGCSAPIWMTFKQAIDLGA